MGGRLVSRTYVEQVLLPSLDDTARGTCATLAVRLAAWWRRVSPALGPASSARAVCDLAVIPLLELLGHRRPPLASHSWGLTGAVDGVLILSLPWAIGPGAAWREALRAGLAGGARWAIAANGPSLFVLDGLRPWSRRILELDLAALAADPRGAAILWSLARRDLFDGEPVPFGQMVAASDALAASVCRSLGGAVLDTLPRLASALASPSRRGAPASPLHAYEQALTVVYRVLFLLFAEARGLVPVWHEVYRRAYTIDALCTRIDRRPEAPGLWAALRAISRMGHAGCRAGDLEVTAFNGRLFSPAHAPLVEGRAIPDALAADLVRALATTEGRGGRHRVGYHDLGVEQLGAVYERVLDFEPARSGRAVALTRDATGRKASGSFYTPRAITEFLVRRTLHPLVEGRTADDILSLRIVDPAMGSGAFLVAACRYLADQCERARVRDGEWMAPEVTAADRATLRRLVAERCLYGVDANPIAVQLARLSLWLTTLAADKPLTFLDHHLAVGDSLIGASPADLSRPPLARLANKPRTMGQLALFEEGDASVMSERVLPARSDLALVPSDSLEAVRLKERSLAGLAAPDGPSARWRNACDRWCALALWPGTPPGPGVAADLVADALGRPASLSARDRGRLVEEADAVARAHAPFHWPLSFPEVFFGTDGRPRGDAGFDAVIGNPPWDVLRADAGGRERRDDDRARARPEMRFFRASGLYRWQGDGHCNRYQLFLERAWQLTRPGGRVGLILPSGIATDHGSAALRRRMLETSTVDTWLDFDNRHGIFPIHRQVRFVVLAATQAGATETLRYRCGLTDASSLERRPSAPGEDVDAGAVAVPRARLERWDPDDLSVPRLPDNEAYAVLLKAGDAAPPLSSPEGWGARFGRELNATEDAAHFTARSPHRRGAWLPVIEGKHLSPFQLHDDRADRVVSRRAAAALIDEAATFGRPRIAYRDVAGATNRLTLIAAVLPAGVVSTHTVFCLKTPLAEGARWCLLALLNSLVANYLVRLRMTTHVTAGLMARLPVPRPAAGTAEATELARLARSLSTTGLDGDPASYARLNAIAARLYGLSPTAYALVVASFPLLPASLREACLSAFHPLSVERRQP